MSKTPSLLHFTPVPHQRRARGWTADAQRACIDALSRCGVVAQAARSVGCSPRSAYHLRQKAGGESFAAAWDWALEMGLDESRARAFALIGGREERPIIRRGELVGVRLVSNHRVMLAALRAISAERTGQRANMPHRQRIALRDMLDTICAMGPLDPTDWDALRRAVTIPPPGSAGPAALS
ncbi:hypothetical protein MOK15_00490 [Sphingobium sp. BYY-5]|uniref:hypothetical protein n=1 Tax=Sphingobium sp. BYY-5 TaxID=2926400 RepID=UPI001FA776AA|nr:hypothetical protein [Sphingobium sp. BYY-5]MCI4588586.1 hypothetical protein [Sphingobium sp. BYY-5]